MADKLIEQVNCHSCGVTHYGLKSEDKGRAVTCPVTGDQVSTATGKVIRVQDEPTPTPKPAKKTGKGKKDEPDGDAENE